jgi:hypothetical protein
MGNEYELAIQPVEQGELGTELDKSDESAQSMNSRSIDITRENGLHTQETADGRLSTTTSEVKQRSKWRLIAIVSALFVRLHGEFVNHLADACV